jgi:outer membrane protein TolC
MQAQEQYDLKRCIETGIEQNYSIRIVRNEQQVANNNATWGNAGALPTLDLTANGSAAMDNTHRKLNDGTSEDTNGATSEAAQAALSLNWMLFDGLGIQAEYDKLKELSLLGELNTRLTIEDFVASLAAEYYNLVRQKIRLRNLRSTVALSKERLRIVEERYNIGSMSLLDLQQAKVYFNADSSKLLTQFEAVYASRIRLNELMAVEDVSAPILLSDSIIYPNVSLNKANLWDEVLTNNVSLLMAEQARTLSEINYRKAKSRNYPYLKLNASYGLNNNWHEIGTTELQRKLGINAGVTVGINLFDGMNRKRTQRNARIEIETESLRKEQLSLSLKSDMSNLWMAYQNNLELWELEKENRVVATENYAIAIERYKLGDLSGIELREAQNGLLEAEERQSIVEYATKVCEISLLQLSGELALLLQ